VEAGAKKLSQLYTKIVAEASSGSTPLSLSSPTTTLPPALIAGSDRPNSTTKAEAPFSASLLTSLQPVVTSLRKMPLPSTHPSHPTAVSILGALKDAQRGYAEMRGGWARKCLEVGGRRIKERVDSATDDDEGGRSGRGGRIGEGGPGMAKADEIAKWIGEVIEVADVCLPNSPPLLRFPLSLR
jgi:exocyst complex protein 7